MAQLVNKEDYKAKGYFMKETISAKGFVTVRDYYKSYDAQSDTYSNLKVREDISQTFDSVTGLVTAETKICRWYKAGVEMTNSQVTDNFDSIQGYEKSQKGRAKLVAIASMQLMGAVGTDNARAFLSTVITEREEYIAGNRAPLVNAINNSTEPYMTQAIKDTLVLTLDIDYGV